MLIDPKDLTTGERLRLDRRRAGLTQRQAAALMGYSFRAYVRAERDQDGSAPAPPVKELTPGEECRIMRERNGMTLRQLEEATGFKSKWIHRVETGVVMSAEPLVAFWEAEKR